jgi:hypothetical protein
VSTSPTADARFDVAAVKQAARDRWPEILSALGGISKDILDGKHHPCPKCGGIDRFRLIDAQDGACLCNQCFDKKNGDGIAALGWLSGQGFGDTIKRLAEYLGIQPSQNGHANGQPKAKKKGGGAVYATLEAAIKVGILPGLTHDYPGEPKPHVVRTDRYDTFVVLRFDLPTPPGKKQDKTFRPVHSIKLSDGRAVWKLGYPPGKRPLYHRAELEAASDTSLAVVVAGEKATEAAANLGLIATTCAGGEKAIGKTDWSPLARFDQVVVSTDNDATGRDFGYLVTEQVHQVKANLPVKILLLPDLPPKGDIVDWIAAGGTREQFLELAESTPVVTAEAIAQWQAEGKAEDRPRITNAKLVETPDGVVAAPLPMNAVIDGIFLATGGWPKRVGNNLFIQDEDRVCWLDSAAACFGWLGRRCGTIHWSRVSGCVSKEETFAELCRTAEAYAAVESLPHWPRLETHYYLCEFPQPGDGTTLAQFLDFFTPATPIDRQLLTAKLATPLWGGPPGARPAGLFTSTKGRGKGKSVLAQFIGRLYGGFLDISASEEIVVIKQRLLSPEAVGIRIALLDNVKSTRFSWAELEALITTDVISGKRMYTGESRRPNLITWLITLNGASLSTDMAQRVIEVRLADPEYREGWEEEVAAFIRDNQTAIIADLIAVLQRPPKHMRRHSRWATWEGQVLARIDNPDECLDTILERRSQVDVEQEEGGIIEDYFASRLRALNYNTETEDVFISNAVTTQWYNQATNDRKKTTGVTRALKQLWDEGRVTRILPCRVTGGNRDRGFHWVGEHCDSMATMKMDLEHRLAEKGDRHESQAVEGSENGDF